MSIYKVHTCPCYYLSIEMPDDHCIKLNKLCDGKYITIGPNNKIFINMGISSFLEYEGFCTTDPSKTEIKYTLLKGKFESSFMTCDERIITMCSDLGLISINKERDYNNRNGRFYKFSMNKLIERTDVDSPTLSGLKDAKGAVSSSNDLYFITDAGSQCIIGFSCTTGSRWILSGGNGKGYEDGDKTVAKFLNPTRLDVFENGDLLVLDHGNDALRLVTPDGTTSTFWPRTSKRKTRSTAALNDARDISIDKTGAVAVANTGSGEILLIRDGKMEVVYKSTSPEMSPISVAIDQSGRIFALPAKKDYCLIVVETNLSAGVTSNTMKICTNSMDVFTSLTFGLLFDGRSRIGFGNRHVLENESEKKRKLELRISNFETEFENIKKRARTSLDNSIKMLDAIQDDWVDAKVQTSHLGMAQGIRCPITTLFISQPFLAKNGQTYEKGAIENWFDKNKTFPNSEELLTDEKDFKIFQNRCLQDILTSSSNHEDAIRCPITKMVMRDPVMAMDGYTYDRTSIEPWLMNNKSFPMTNQVAKDPSDFDLIPNRAVASIIRQRRETATKAMISELKLGGCIPAL